MTEETLSLFFQITCRILEKIKPSGKIATKETIEILTSKGFHFKKEYIKKIEGEGENYIK